jgi:hypothetical protein
MNASQTPVALAALAMTQGMGTIAFVHLDFLELIVKLVCLINVIINKFEEKTVLDRG